MRLPSSSLISAKARARLRLRNCELPSKEGKHMNIGKRCLRVTALTIGLCCLWALAAVSSAPAQNAPVYKVDPFWPKPLPHKWIMQQVPTLTVDKDDHIWVLNRSEEHTSELQSHVNLVCRLLLE